MLKKGLFFSSFPQKQKRHKTIKQTPKHVECAAEAERGGKRTREEAKSGMGRLERMNHGSGIKSRNDKSNGIEILNGQYFRQNQPDGPPKIG
jgi:hypothetical protein